MRLATAAVAEAGRRDAEVICVPECFVPGYRWPTGAAVSADGQRFLIKTVLDGLTESPLTMILNWTPDK